jgi:hypothetical protein
LSATTESSSSYNKSQCCGVQTARRFFRPPDCYEEFLRNLQWMI